MTMDGRVDGNSGTGGSGLATFSSSSDVPGICPISTSMAWVIWEIWVFSGSRAAVCESSSALACAICMVLPTPSRYSRLVRS